MYRGCRPNPRWLKDSKICWPANKKTCEINSPKCTYSPPDFCSHRGIRLAAVHQWQSERCGLQRNCSSSVVPFLHRYSNIVFQHNNACPHIARMVTDCLIEENVSVLPWPVCSPDHSPIEHVWDVMNRRLSKRRNPPQTRQQLKQALTNIWNAIPQTFFDSLDRSMRRRIVGCITAQGVQDIELLVLLHQ